MRWSWLLLTCVLSVRPAVAAADPPRVGWNDVQPLLKDHPALGIAMADRAAAEGARLGARAVSNPELSASLGRAHAHVGDEAAAVWGLEGELTVPWPGVLAARGEGAEARIEEALARELAAWRAVRSYTREMFLTVARDQWVTSLWGTAVAEAEELERAVQTRVDRGQDPPLEALRARAELERARMEAERTGLQLALHRDAIHRWLGEPFPAEFVVDAPQEEHATAVDEDLRARVLETHPALWSARAGTRAAEAELRHARAEAVPELVVGAGYETELDLWAVQGTVGLELPLLAPGVGPIREARAEVTRADHEAELARREVQLAFDAAWTAYRSADLAAGRYREGIVPAARTAADALTLAYRAGEVSLLDVLDARRVWLEVQVEQADVDLELTLALDAIHTLSGEYDDEM